MDLTYNTQSVIKLLSATLHWKSPERQDMPFTPFVMRVLPVNGHCVLSSLHLDFPIRCDHFYNVLLLLGYYDFIGEAAAMKLGHQESEYLAACNFIVLSGTQISMQPCQVLGRVKLLPGPKYFNCYTIEYFPGKGLSIIVTAYSIIQ